MNIVVLAGGLSTERDVSFKSGDGMAKALRRLGHKAILLLDDVLSELDKERQHYLIEAMKDVQVFVTATEIEEDLINILPKGKIFNVQNGLIK